MADSRFEHERPKLMGASFIVMSATSSRVMPSGGGGHLKTIVFRTNIQSNLRVLSNQSSRWASVSELKQLVIGRALRRDRGAHRKRCLWSASEGRHHPLRLLRRCLVRSCERATNMDNWRPRTLRCRPRRRAGSDGAFKYPRTGSLCDECSAAALVDALNAEDGKRCRQSAQL